MAQRKATLWIEPSQPLMALYSLKQSSAHLSAVFAEALAVELATKERQLASLCNCLWWLHEAEVFRVVRSARQRWAQWTQGQPLPALSMLSGTISIHVDALCSAIENDPANINATVTSAAIRSILQAVKQGDILQAGDYRFGAKSISLAQFADKISDLLQRSEQIASKRKASVKPEPKTTKTAKPTAKTTTAQKTEKAPKKKAKVHSFGGLPDDAQPTNRQEAVEPLSARGLSLDAEFFLEQAKLSWPCSAEQMERARKAVLARLHPDRAGSDSTALFQRAMRGWQALGKQLPKDVTSKATPTPAPVTPVPKAKPTATVVGQWPPPPQPSVQRTAKVGTR